MARFPLTLGESYLLEYPQADLPGADSYFYWEKVNFGLKPAIRASHYFPYRLGSLGLRFRHGETRWLLFAHHQRLGAGGVDRSQRFHPAKGGRGQDALVAGDRARLDQESRRMVGAGLGTLMFVVDTLVDSHCLRWMSTGTLARAE
jgi:hypothetical protein